MSSHNFLGNRPARQFHSMEWLDPAEFTVNPDYMAYATERLLGRTDAKSLDAYKKGSRPAGPAPVVADRPAPRAATPKAGPLPVFRPAGMPVPSFAQVNNVPPTLRQEQAPARVQAAPQVPEKAPVPERPASTPRQSTPCQNVPSNVHFPAVSGRVVSPRVAAILQRASERLDEESRQSPVSDSSSDKISGKSSTGVQSSHDSSITTPEEAPPAQANNAFAIDMARFQNDPAYRAQVQAKLAGIVPEAPKASVQEEAPKPRPQPAPHVEHEPEEILGDPQYRFQDILPTVGMPPHILEVERRNLLDARAQDPSGQLEKLVAESLHEARLLYFTQFPKEAPAWMRLQLPRRPVPQPERIKQAYVPPIYSYVDANGNYVQNSGPHLAAQMVNRRIAAMNHQREAQAELARGERLMSINLSDYVKDRANDPIYTDIMCQIGMTREDLLGDMARFKRAWEQKRLPKGVRRAAAVGGFFTLCLSYAWSSHHDDHITMRAVRKDMNLRNAELFSQKKPWQWQLEFVQGVPNMYEASVFHSPVD